MCMPETNLFAATCYTSITGYQPGLQPAYKETIDTAGRTIRVSMINLSVVDMYLRALNMIGLPPAYIVPLTGDEEVNRKDLVNQPLFCYGSVEPIDVPVSDRRQRMLSALNSYFSLDGRMERRRVECLVLTCATQYDIFSPYSFTAGGITIHRLIHTLNHAWYNCPVLDETRMNSSHPVGITRRDLANITHLRLKIALHGFSLNKAERETEMFVLSRI